LIPMHAVATTVCRTPARSVRRDEQTPALARGARDVQVTLTLADAAGTSTPEDRMIDSVRLPRTTSRSS
jgi:hypothetical protein